MCREGFLFGRKGVFYFSFMKLFKRLFKRKQKAPDKTIAPEQHIEWNNLIASYSTSVSEPMPMPKPLSEITFIYCLVGNIVEVRYNESEQKTFMGTKHFSPGTKVYCFPPQWGDGYEKIKVIGRCRKSKRFITIIIASKNVINWRLKTVYNPYIIKEMYERGWGYEESDKEDIIKLAASLNNNS